MPGKEIQAQLRVFSSPDGSQIDTWPLREARVHLKQDGKIRHRSKTKADGITGNVTLTPGATYQVELPDHPWSDYWQGAELRVAEDDVHKDIWLTPIPGHHFFALRLSTNSGEPVAGGTVRVTADEPTFNATFTADCEGHVYAVAPAANVMLEFNSEEVDGTRFCPRDFFVPYTVPKADVRALGLDYWPAIQIVAAPTVTTSGPPEAAPSPLYGTNVTVEYRVSAQAISTSRTKALTKPANPKSPAEITFEYPFPGDYRVTVEPPPTWTDLPIEAGPARKTDRPLPPGSWRTLTPGAPWTVPADFGVVPTNEITILVTTPDDLLLAGNPQLRISYGAAGTTVAVDTATGKGTAKVPQKIPAKISLAPGTATIDNTIPGTARKIAIPLKMAAPDQEVDPGAVNTVALTYEYPLTVKARDGMDRPVRGAVIDVFDRHQSLVGDGVTGVNGDFVIGVSGRGTYYVSQHSVGGFPAIRESAQVNSPGEVTVLIKGADGEALTDLSAYPLLTEEISTTGIPAPAGGPGGGGGYGQAVDQAMRDVLGWRPGGDVSGFRAALTGAFQLREVEGHTQWTWQQRGYAVQADMGALAGAQASIYARAKSALDQILPLLAGLTPLNPALFPPQDLEAIRTVITTELQELVTELALQGGPRIQRVDQLFHLLTGEGVGSRNLNPDVVQGNLGTLRDRFGLTVDEIDTVDEERIVTNFRIVVEQVLSLQASWSTDRGLLAPLDPRASFGTVLIWLSRSLEAVCESVGDLTFALDSVFVDAAQRQVIELRLPGEEALLLSDLLDWVERASRDEGPRIIQDAGKDGVFAFAPVLRKLRDLIRATRHAARHERGLPDGMRTPRVDRALQVLVAQLGEATDLAGQIRRDAPPLIEAALVSVPEFGQRQALETPPGKPASIKVEIFGANFRANASAVLIAQDREDLPELHTRSIKVISPSLITTTFRIPTTVHDSAGVTWLVAVTNEDGTHSNQFPI